MRNSDNESLIEDKQPEPLAHTVAEAARISRSSRSTIYEALQRRELKGKKLGRRTIILREALASYLASLPNFGDAPDPSEADDD